MSVQGGDGPELGEVVGKYMDVGHRKEEGEELRLGRKDIKKNPTGQEVEGLLRLQDNSKGCEWSELDKEGAGKVEMRGLLERNERAKRPDFDDVTEG